MAYYFDMSFFCYIFALRNFKNKIMKNKSSLNTFLWCLWSIILIMFFITNCTRFPNEKVTVKISRGGRFVGTRFEFENHKYIMFDDEKSHGYDCGIGYVHDPDCWCLKK